MREEVDVSAGVAAIRTLLTVIENYKGDSLFLVVNLDPGVE